MRSYVTELSFNVAVLLDAGLDAVYADAQPQPPAGKLREIEHAFGETKRHRGLYGSTAA
ncbi:MAG TPA: hypothetical protein VES20_00905 [Bryobacteraceae bacterium]|nr:hypothetical protein [Bryobacteraceae bacterium]